MAPKKARKSTGTGSVLKVRKSTAPASTASRRSAPTRNADASDEENVNQSSNRRKRAASDESDEESDAVDVEASLVTSPSKKGSKTTPTSATKAKKAPARAATPSSASDEEDEDADNKAADETIVVAPAAPSKGRKGTKKTGAVEDKKRRKSTTATSADSDSEDDVSSSISRSGKGGYTWDVAAVKLKPNDIGTKLTYHPELRVKLTRDDIERRYLFERDQKIWVLPDPKWLPARSKEIDIDDLPNDEFWVARILDCLKVDQTDTNPNDKVLGLLRVAWEYSPDDALALVGNDRNLHESYRSRLTKYRFAPDERIMSDHVDFISLEAFAGFADINSYLSLTGLEVTDADRLRDAKHRAKRTRSVYLTGWGNKARELAAEQIEKRKSKSKRRKVAADAETEE